MTTRTLSFLALASIIPMTGPINMGPSLRVGVIGDSISVIGSGPSGIAHYPWWVYLQRLQSAAGADWEVQCEAVGGERVTDHFQAQLDALLYGPDGPPDLILAMGGVNDIAAGVDHQAIQDAMHMLQQIANAEGSELYWFEPPGVVGMPEVYGNLEWDFKHNLPVDNDNYLEEIGDHVHPMGRMHADMGQAFFQVLPE